MTGLGRTLAGAVATLVFVFVAPFLFIVARTRRGWRRRLGLYELDPTRPRAFFVGEGPRVWLHGASAGDVLGLVPIVKELRALRPDVRVIVSAITDSGASMAEQKLLVPNLCDAVTWLPWDIPPSVRGALRAVRPDVLVLEYTELWPQLIHQAADAGVKLVLTNGRIGPRNVPRYRLLFALVGNLLLRFDLLLMRADDDAERAFQLKATKGRVHVTGNTKFDALSTSVPSEGTDPVLAEALGCAGERVWVCGSTHEGEEGPLLEIFAHLRREFSDLRLVLAPRYVERAAKVLALARSLGLSARLRSTPGGAEAVVVLDTIGELVRAYTVATIVFVGGSFGERGGQNILEPAGCGKPVLFGPCMENFIDPVQVLVGRGGLQVNTFPALEQLLRDLFARPDELKKLGQLAREASNSVRGASLKDARLIAGLLPRAR